MRYRHSPQGEEERQNREAVGLRAQSVIAIWCSHFKPPPTAVSNVVKGGDGSTSHSWRGPQKLYEGKLQLGTTFRWLKGKFRPKNNDYIHQDFQS